MAEFTKAMENNVSNNNALLLHIQTRFKESEADALTPDELGRIEKMNKEILALKDGAVTMDFGSDATKEDVVKACQEISDRCKSNPDSNAFLNLENVFGKGMTSHKELVDNLIQNRTLPTGEKLPDNAILLMTMQDKDLNDPEVENNFERYNGEVQSACGTFVDIPRVPTDRELADMSATFASLQSQKESLREP